MATVEDCPGFETFGADVKAARKAKHQKKKETENVWKHPPFCHRAEQLSDFYAFFKEVPHFSSLSAPHELRAKLIR